MLNRPSPDPFPLRRPRAIALTTIVLRLERPGYHFTRLRRRVLHLRNGNRYDTPALATARILDADHPYQTRILVRRPVDSRRFNGTVVVEWDNVTNGFDADNMWFFAWEHLLRGGYAWVGVSVQRVGVEKLRDWNASRYGALDVCPGRFDKQRCAAV